ncbi:MAG TPA: alanine racemase [Pyrinomonadaceae bacterium]|nr:alanine racemase [Pyrinomonadaceae bacterium]
MLFSRNARPTRAEINLENLKFNFYSVKNFIGEDIKYMAVVKADAYGHGAVECATMLEKAGIDCFGVALPEEGLTLRENGIKKTVICLGGFWMGQEEFLLDNNLIPVIYSLEMAEKFDKAAREKNKTAAVHIKIDTGMGRIGVRFDEATEFAGKLNQFKNLNVEGLMTHFAAADDLLENEFTDTQIKRFNQTVEIFESKGFKLIFKDLANSPGAIAHKNSRGNMVRLGGVLYGLGGDVLPKEIDKPELRPVMALYSKINQLKIVPKGETLGYNRTYKTERDSLIATIPIGYHDGYPRSLSNRGRVIINGRFAPVVGRISMDWTLIDVTEFQDLKVNDEVILIGDSCGLNIKAEDLAELIGTISYEITCGINNRVVKVYK